VLVLIVACFKVVLVAECLDTAAHLVRSRMYSEKGSHVAPKVGYKQDFQK
jgi:hypothetical protein